MSLVGFPSEMGALLCLSTLNPFLVVLIGTFLGCRCPRSWGMGAVGEDRLALLVRGDQGPLLGVSLLTARQV